MSFSDPTANQVPTSIGIIEIRIRTKPDGQGGVDESISHYFEILDQDGGIHEMRRGNTAPHLTAQEISGLQALLTRLRGLATTVIP